MLDAKEHPDLRVSNWTLATGTRPGERPIADLEAGPGAPVQSQRSVDALSILQAETSAGERVD
jgi:hypothetical protein